ncbi:hypothetical protein J3R30DRAFT_3216307, partial [Lentinula aciculospora]
SSFFAGSTRWMAPELVLTLVGDNDTGDAHVEGEIRAGAEKRTPRVTTASDVYAFASVCLEIVTGNLPYPHRKNDYSVTVDIIRGVSPARGSDLPFAGETDEEAFHSILERCWDSESFLRPNMEEVLVRLNGI